MTQDDNLALTDTQEENNRSDIRIHEKTLVIFPFQPPIFSFQPHKKQTP